MITINGVKFYYMPGSCGTCEFFHSGSSSICPQQRGYCSLFKEMHNSWINVPRRCQKLFNKAFKMPEGTDLVIVYND